MRASTSRFASDFSRPYFEARWVTRSFLFLSDDRSSSENLPHLARISLMTICLVSAADVACPALKFVSKDTLKSFQKTHWMVNSYMVNLSSTYLQNDVKFVVELWFLSPNIYIWLNWGEKES